MAKSLFLPPDGPMIFTLAALRALDFTGTGVNGQHIVPGVFFGFDSPAADVLRLESRPGSLIRFSLGADAPGRWLTFHMTLGAADYSDCKLLGFACRSSAAEPTSFRVCLRSGVEGGHRDVMLGEPVITGPQVSADLDVVNLDDTPTLPLTAPWRELMLVFKTDTPAINLLDFRLIVI